MTPNKGGRKYAMIDKKDKDVHLRTITMIDPVSGCIEILSMTEARADLVANQVGEVWLNRHSLPHIVTVDRGKELLT